MTIATLTTEKPTMKTYQLFIASPTNSGACGGGKACG